jgi:hypothetical protein
MVLRALNVVKLVVKPSKARLALRLWPRRWPVSLPLLHPVCVCVCVCVCVYVYVHTHKNHCHRADSLGRNIHVHIYYVSMTPHDVILCDFVRIH